MVRFAWILSVWILFVGTLCAQTVDEDVDLSDLDFTSRPASTDATATRNATRFDPLVTSDEKFNFQIRSPGPDWIVKRKSVDGPYEIEFTNPNGMKISFLARRPANRFASVPEWENHTKLLYPPFEVTAAPSKMGSYDAVSIRREIDGAIGIYRILVFEDMHYEINSVTAKAFESAWVAQHHILAKSFRLLDLSRIRPLKKTSPILKIDEYGYELPAIRQWHQKPELPHVSYTSCHFDPDRLTFWVASAPLQDVDVPVSEIHNTMATIDSGPSTKPQTIDGIGSLNAKRYAPHKHPHSGETHYRYTLVGKEYCYLVAIIAKNQADADHLIRAAKFDLPGASLPDGRIDRTRRAHFFDHLAREAVKRRDYRAARQRIERAIEFDPKLPESYATLSASCKSLEDIASACNILRRNLEQFKDSPRPLWLFASLLGVVKRHDEALKVCGILFDAPGERTDSDRILYINCLSRVGRFDDALAMLARGPSDNLEFICAKARVIFAKGQRYEAIASIETQQEKMGFNPLLEQVLLEFYQATGEARKLLATADRIIAKAGDEGEDKGTAYLYRGRALVKMKRYQEAKVAYERALAQLPDDMFVKSALADLMPLLGSESR